MLHNSGESLNLNYSLNYVMRINQFKIVTVIVCTKKYKKIKIQNRIVKQDLCMQFKKRGQTKYIF